MAQFQLDLKINGVDTTINSINELEEALKASKAEMSSLALGTKEFENAASNIRKIDGALKEVKLQTEGVNTKQLAGSFAKLGETVAGSFAIATNAAELFGSKSEDVSKAQVKAQQAIAVVMGARAVAEGIVEGKAAARLLVDKATLVTTNLMTAAFGKEAVAAASAATATEGAALSTQALGVAMKALPIVAIITGIVAIVAAVANWDDGQQELLETLEKSTDQLKSYEKYITSITSIQVKLAEDAVKIAQARGASIEEIQKLEEEAFKAKQQQYKDEVDIAARTYAEKYVLLEAAINAEDEAKIEQYTKEKADATQQLNILKEQQKLFASERELFEAEQEKKRKDARKQRNEEYVKEQKEAAKKVADELGIIEKLKADVADASVKTELDRINVKYQSEKEYIEKNIADKTRQAEAIAFLDEKYNILRKQKLNEQLSIEEQYIANRTKLESQFNEKLNNDRKAVQENLNSSLLSKKEKLARLEKKLDEDATREAEARKLEIMTIYSNERLKIRAKELQSSGVMTEEEQRQYDEIQKQILYNEQAASNAKKQIDDDLVEKKKENAQKVKTAQQEALEEGLQQALDIATKIVDATNQVLNTLAESRRVDLNNALIDTENAATAETNVKIKQYNAEKIALNEKYKSGVISQQEYNKQVTAIDKKLSKDKEDIDKRRAAQEDKLKRANFEKEKNLKIAQVWMTGILSAMQAFNGMVSFAPGPVGIALGAVAAAGVLALTAVQSNNIKKQKYDGAQVVASQVETVDVPDTSTGASGNASNVERASQGGFTAFSPNAIGSPGGTTTDSSGGGGQRVYVLESDITGTQRKVSVQESNSTF